MEPLDLRKFIWTKDDRWFIILTITKLKEYDVVIFRESTNAKGGAVFVETVDDFMRTHSATYQLRT